MVAIVSRNNLNILTISSTDKRYNQTKAIQNCPNESVKNDSIRMFCWQLFQHFNNCFSCYTIFKRNPKAQLSLNTVKSKSALLGTLLSIPSLGEILKTLSCCTFEKYEHYCCGYKS